MKTCREGHVICDRAIKVMGLINALVYSICEVLETMLISLFWI